MPKYLDLTLDLALELGEGEENMLMHETLKRRLSSIETEHSFFKTWCDRADKLYFATTFTDWGADMWPDDESATTEGRSHVSINEPPVYVDIPASLESVKPIENMLATEDSDEARSTAQAMESLRSQWKIEEKWQLKRHKGAIVKGLYGKTYGYLYWDPDLGPKGRVCAEIIQNPRNVYLGYKSDDYEEVEWAATISRVDPMALKEKYSVDVTLRSADGGSIVGIESGRVAPWLSERIADVPYPEMNYGPARVEVWDYWYRAPAKTRKKPKLGTPTKMATWHVVVAGNMVVQGPNEYKEYGGVIPFMQLNNTFIPSVPTGRSDLWDMEQLIWETMERITSGSQQIAGATAGDFWQLTGPDAPSRVPASVKPKRNQVIAPGAGNRIEAIQPFTAQFQLEQFLGRIDRHKTVISGMNELILGLVPATALSSSKAVNALLSNYEARIAIKRLIFYSWEKDMWDLTVKVWAYHDTRVAELIADGGGVLEMQDPSLTPRDDMETATRAGNLVNEKLWSQARGMDAVGVDDPEQEQNIIRAERTDATLFPADVQVMAQLLAALNELQLQAPQGVQDQVSAQQSRGANDLRTALGAGTPTNGPGAPAGGDTGQTPPDALSPGGTPPGGGSTKLQGMIQGGEAKGRILTNQEL